MKVEIGKWLPDFGPEVNGLVLARNVISRNGKWIPFRAAKAFIEDTPDDTPQCLFSALDNSRSVTTFLAGDDYIYRLATDTLVDVSVTGGYNGTDASFWDYDVYGDALIFTNFNDPVQISNPMSTEDFANLTGSPPKARLAKMYDEHLFLGYVNISGTVHSRRLYRSAKGNIEDWTVSATSGCGYKDLASWGDSLVSLERIGTYLLAYMDSTVWLIDSIGAPYWFAYYKIYEGDGPISAKSVVKLDNNTHMFISPNDIFRVEAQNIKPIGLGVRNTVIEDINLGAKNRITSFVDYGTKSVMWSYVSANNQTLIPDKILIYNYEEDKFSTIDMNLYCLGRMYTQDMVIHALDQYGFIHDVNLPFDSAKFRGGTGLIGCVNSSKEIATLDGAAMDVELKTGQVKVDSLQTITRLIPHVVDLEGDVTIDVYVKMHSNESFPAPHLGIADSNLDIDLRATGKVFQLNIKTSGEHEGIDYIDVEATQRGKR